MDTLFTVFVSSTFVDLQAERQLVANTLLDNSCVPLGMEFFPASGATPWKVISKTIADADFAVLIIAGRYGSLWRGKKSWTEREYDEVRKAKKEVIALVHRDPSALPLKKCDTDPALIGALDAFRSRVNRDITVRYWSDHASLVSGLSASLRALTSGGDLIGWSRHPTTSSGRPIDFASLQSSGLLELQLDFYKKVDWSNLLSASSEIDLFFTYARSWRRQLTKELNALSSRPVRLRVLLPDTSPGNTTAISEIAKRAGDTEANIVAYIDDAIKYYKGIGAEVWCCDQAQLFTSYRFDDVVVAAMYNHRRGHAATLPVLVCEAGGELFDFFREDFEYMLQHYAKQV